MKILQINSVYGIGSTGRIVADLAKIIEDSGLQSYVAYGHGDDIKNPNFYKMQNQTYLKYNIAKTRIFGKHGFYNISATKKLIKWIEQIKPDIIHLHNIHGHYINIKLLFNYIKKENIKVIWTLHDCWTFTGHCAYFDYIQCDKWQKLCSNCPQLNSYPSSLLLDRSKESYLEKKEIFNGVHQMIIITPSHWLENLVHQSFLKNYSTKVINNGIDLNTFKIMPTSFKKDNNIENKTIILGVAMEFDKRKGYEIFLELAKRLDNSFCIVLVGVTKEQLETLPKNIIGITKTHNTKELCEIYNAADMFVNPTLEDNFPTVNLEALACGTPVITFKTGGSVESVDCSTGEIVERGNIVELIKAINKIKRNGKEHYRKNCIEKARQQYDKYNRYIDYIRLYEGKET